MQLKVMPLEMMSYPDVFQTWHKCQPYYSTFKNKNKKMGSPCLFFPYFPIILSGFFLVVSKMFKTETIIFVKKSYFMAKAAYLTKGLSMFVCLGEGTWASFNKNTFLAG